MNTVNTGVALGWGIGIPVWVVGVVLLVVIVVAVKTRELWGRVGLGMLIVGGAANLYLRIKYGGVVDNLSLFGILYNNVWDYLIVGGMLVYGYTFFGKSANRRISDDRKD